MAKLKRFSAKDKATVLKKHLQKKVTISDVCNEYGCSPGSVYQWQDTLFSRAHMIFESSANRVGRPQDCATQSRKMEEIEKKLAAKNAIIAELMEELLLEKKLAGVT